MFKDPEKLKALNSIIHPKVAMHTLQWIEQHKSAPYTLKEAALLFESNSHQALDKIIVVDAPLELRINRTISRDQTSRKAVLARIDKQWPQADKLKRADYIIQNDGDQPLFDQIAKIHLDIIRSL